MKVPNPADPSETDDQSRTTSSTGTWRDDDMRLSGPSLVLVRLADALPDWLGSIRFRLTVLYSVVLFGLAAFMVAGIYAVLATRLDEERVYVNREVTLVERGPDGTVLTPTEVRAEYRSVEALANARALGLLRTYSLSALVVLFLTSLVVGWLVAGRVLAPIGRITAVAREIQATDLSRRIGLRGPPDELRELADTFDAMLTRLDEAFGSQQRFIQEASHELRNPLAVMRTNIDVALADPDPDPADLRRTVELVGRTAERMARLVDDLLVYARMGAPAHEVGPVDLRELATEAVEEFRISAQLRGLELVDKGGDQGPATVSGDRIALRRAVANLLTNAVRLAPQGTTITVGVGTDATGPWLAVADQGPGVAPEDRNRVFERFWRGGAASAREDGRSGLGLAIVDQIMRDHGGSVDLVDNPGGGSVFQLRFGAEPPASSRP